MTGARVLVRSGGLIAVDKPAGVLVVPGRKDRASPAPTAAGKPRPAGVGGPPARPGHHRRAAVCPRRSLPPRRQLGLRGRGGAQDVPCPGIAAAREAAGGGGVPVARAPGKDAVGRSRRGGQAGAHPPAPAGALFAGRSGGGRASHRPDAPDSPAPASCRFSAAGRPAVRAAGAPHRGRPGRTDEAVVLARTPLHATRLVLPAGGGLPAVDVEAPLPDDMQRTLALLRLTGPR